MSTFCFARNTTSFDLISEVLHIPEWLPGSWINREARVAREWGVRMVEAPYQYVQRRMVSIVRLDRGQDGDDLVLI